MLSEARAIVAELLPLLPSLSRLDRRFVESWGLHLERKGDQARVNEVRLKWLRELRDAPRGELRVKK